MGFETGTDRIANPGRMTNAPLVRPTSLMPTWEEQELLMFAESKVIAQNHSRAHPVTRFSFLVIC